MSCSVSLLAFALTSFRSLLIPFLFTFMLFPAVFKLAFILNVDSLLLSLFLSHINKCTFFSFYFFPSLLLFFHFSLFAHTHHPHPFLFSFSVLTIRESVPQNCLMWFIFEVVIVDGRGFPDTECTLAQTYIWIKRKGSRVYMGIVRASVCESYCAHSLMHYFWWTRWICLSSVWCTGIHILLRRI